MIQRMSEKWKFKHCKNNEEQLYWERGFDDSSWNPVIVPHDWAVEMPFDKSNSSGTGYLSGGIGWYRLHFYIPEEEKGKEISIVFDGVYKRSQVWCNSYFLGKWANGYTAFSFDITNQVHFGDTENVIAVKVSHEDIADSRWYTGSGINRNVSIITKEPIHMEEDGFVFSSDKVSEHSALLQIEQEVKNNFSAAADIKVECVFTDKSGIVKFKAEKNIFVEQGKTQKIFMEETIGSPDLWSVENPSLYRLTMRLYAEDILRDEEEHSVGIRTFIFDPDEGFSLNNKKMKLKGICLHEDAGCLGTAVPKEVWKRRLVKLKAMGCNAIRMSHNPHSQELYDLCDEMGFLVNDEIFDEWEGPKNKWSTGHNVYPPKHHGYYEDFPQWYKFDIASFIRKNRNHPSIILWSIGNEVDYPNDPYCHPMFQEMTGNNDADKPANERIYNMNKPNAKRLAFLSKLLAEEVKKHDVSRPVTLAAAFPELSSHIGFLDSVDVIGYNYKEHLYDEDHKRFPDKPFYGSENNHGYQQWLDVVNRDFIAGQFLWTGIDYLGEAHGWPVHGSGAGIMTLAGFEKASYYRRQSLWSEYKVLHLATMRYRDDCKEYTPVYESWNYTMGELIEVRCYTNLPEVSFYINGELNGRAVKNASCDYVKWLVPFESGVITVCDSESGTLSDSLYTTYSACQILAGIWEDKDASVVAREIIQLEVTIADANGRRVVTDNSKLYVNVKNGKCLGIENGDLADVTEYTSNVRRAYEGRLIIYIRPDGNEAVDIVIKGEQLKPAELTV